MIEKGCPFDEDLYSKEIDCSELKDQEQSFVFAGGKAYLGGKYYGEVIHSDEDTIKIKRVSESRYMNGQIVTLKLVNDATGKEISGN